MLQYTAVSTPKGLELVFEREFNMQALLGGFFVSAISAYGFVWLLQRALGVQPVSFFFGLLLCTAAIGCVLAFLIAAMFVHSEIHSHRYLFTKDGITVTNLYWGIAPERKVYVADEVTLFGYGNFTHSSRMCLRFHGRQDFYAMASPVTKEEVDRFPAFLLEHGWSIRIGAFRSTRT